MTPEQYQTQYDSIEAMYEYVAQSKDWEIEEVFGSVDDYTTECLVRLESLGHLWKATGVYVHGELVEVYDIERI